MGEVTLQTEASYHKSWDWDSTAKGLGHPKSCSHLPAVYKDELLKEPWVVWDLGGVEFQGVTSIE